MGKKNSVLISNKIGKFNKSISVESDKSISHRSLLIASGTIVANGTPRQIVNTTEAKKLYFGEDFKI